MFDKTIKEKVAQQAKAASRLREPFQKLEKELGTQIADGYRLQLEIDEQIDLLMEQKSSITGLIVDDESMLTRLRELFKSF